MLKDKKRAALLFFMALFALSSLAQINNDEKPYDNLVIFGDSLSDVGSYRVGPIAAAGGGKFSVNFPGSRIWPERLAEAMGLAALCPAITGFDGALFDFGPVSHHEDCFAYAQGGSRITNEIGIGNAESSLPGGQAGALTVPIVSQIQYYLSQNHFFGEKDLVAVWAGNNDILANILSQSALENVTQASDELVFYIKNMVIENGAKRVIVLNIGDIRYAPLGQSLPLFLKAKINDMIMAFNNRLALGLEAVKDAVLLIDIYSEGRAWAENPGAYGISNVTSGACDLSLTAFPSTLLCTSSTLVAEDTSDYFFADLVHPAPKGHQVIADFVMDKLKQRGWF